MDDGTLVGRRDEVLAHYDKLMTALPKVGLALNPLKCVLWGPGIQGPEDMAPRIPESYPQDHPIRSIPVTVYEPGSGVVCLGPSTERKISHEKCNRKFHGKFLVTKESQIGRQGNISPLGLGKKPSEIFRTFFCA